MLPTSQPEEIYDTYFIGNSENITDYIKVNTPFIDLVVTSPPYWDAKQYGEIEQTGYGQSYESYMESLRKIFKGIYDLSKPTASLYIIIDTIKRNGKVVRLQDDVCSLLESIGWIHRDTIIWDKGKTLPWSRKGQIRNVFEYILFFTKSNDFKYNIDTIKTVEELKEWWRDYPERYNPDGKVPDNIWRFNIPTQGSWGSKITVEDEEFRHACPFPPELMARIVKLSSEKGDVVLDPFAGSGVLLATAELLERRYVGFDTNNQYKSVFEKVTKPLVTKQWPEIQKYYKLQEYLKQIMHSSIRKLRMLKYPKALLKRLKGEEIFKTLEWKFPLVLVIEQPITTDELQKHSKSENILGKVHYYIQYDSNKKNTYQVQQLINDIVGKAPFTKYGLISEVKLISRKTLMTIISQYNLEELYLYSKGNTRSFSKIVTPYDIIESYKNKDNLILFDKDIPPIYSNINIIESEFSIIPAEKYEKKSLLSPYSDIISKMDFELMTDN